MKKVFNLIPARWPGGTGGSTIILVTVSFIRRDTVTGIVGALTRQRAPVKHRGKASGSISYSGFMVVLTNC